MKYKYYIMDRIFFFKKSINAYVWINGQKDGGENVLGQQWMQDEPA